jgi:predicted RNA binding protein YcfA (HicA-like mRNA interferase family)
MVRQGRRNRQRNAPHAWYNQGMKVRDVIRLLEQDGWARIAQKGSHRQFRHPTKPGKVTVAGKMSDEVPRGTLRNLLRQAGLHHES